MADNNESKVNFVRASRNGQWAMLESDGNYFFAHSEGKDTELVKTPAGNAVRTSYRDLADRILNDLDKLGYNYRSPESILAWHFTMIDNFSRMEHSDVEEILDQSFMQRSDWTFEENQDDEGWTAIFGEEVNRNNTIRAWLSKCTHMQMTAACCIGNAYHSINIAFVVARLMENYEGNKLKQKFSHLARQIAENSVYGPAEDIIGDFSTFELYYGIHLNEDGKIINEDLKDECESDKYIGSIVSLEDLIGRNFYLYSNGQKDESQPFELNLSDLELDTESNDEDMTDEDEDEDDYDDEENNLAGYLPEKCWVKRISAAEDGYEAYHLVAITIDNSGKIDNITVILEEVQRMGNGWFMIPGMELEGSSSYEEMDYYPDDVIKELDLLVNHRFLPKEFSFVGKRLPLAMIDEGGNGGSNTEYTYALQSAYRMAYMHMSIDTDESGIIDGFDYSSYQSSGNSYGDMFSRPQYYSDRSDEAVDMLLHILDQYTEQEYKDIMR